MSNEEIGVHNNFFDGTWKPRMFQNTEYAKTRTGSASKSSSSSDGSDALPQNRNSFYQHLTQSAPSMLQRSQMTMESGITNFPHIINSESQQAGNLFPYCTSATTSQLYPPNMTTLEMGNHGPPFQRPQWIGRQSQLQIPVHDFSATFRPQEYFHLSPEIETHNFHPMQLQDMPIQRRVEPSLGLSHPLQSEGMPTDPLGKMKMAWKLDDIPPTPNLHSPNFISQGQGSQHQSYDISDTIRFMRNSVYNPEYEAQGKPIDPHLRLFNQRYENGNKEA